ncbi:MAG: FKBP-type peptidyl-prolyl cis-trans isomerase [Kangiellaceae bacterium]
MKIANDTVVQFLYKMTDTDGEVLEDSTKDLPMAYLHGHNGLLAGLEKAMEGKTKDDEFNVTLKPEEAYGVVKDNAEQKIPMKHLQSMTNNSKIKWKKGMVGVVHTEQGNKRVTVVKPGKFMVVVDFNHPFAGKTLTFAVKVVDVREATNEEIAHGHAHGVGGHQH